MHADDVDLDEVRRSATYRVGLWFARAGLLTWALAIFTLDLNPWMTGAPLIFLLGYVLCERALGIPIWGGPYERNRVRRKLFWRDLFWLKSKVGP